MAIDQTAFFRKCINIYQDSIKESNVELVTKSHKQSRPHERYQLANSEFYNKASSLYKALIILDTLLNDIRPQYLLANSREMSEDQKVVIDTEIKLKIQRLTNKIKNLQDVDKKLSKMEPDSDELSISLEKVGFPISLKSSTTSHTLQSLTRNFISMGDYSDYVSIRNETLRIIFTNVVKSLALKLQHALLTWNEMHDKRIERLVQLKKSALSTSSKHNKINNENNNINMFKLNDENNNTFDIGNKYISEEYETLHRGLPNQELLQLQNEQDSLAEELKKGTLETVTQIESSMMDVASMVREIGVQLSMQNENISLLDQHKDEIVGNVKSGNTVLIKANESNSKRNKTFAWMIFIAALILLFVDFIL
jgi:hypothetical protein